MLAVFPRREFTGSRFEGAAPNLHFSNATEKTCRTTSHSRPRSGPPRARPSTVACPNNRTGLCFKRHLAFLSWVKASFTRFVKPASDERKFRPGLEGGYFTRLASHSMAWPPPPPPCASDVNLISSALTTLPL